MAQFVLDERVERTVALNTASEASELFSTVLKIGRKILEHPDEVRYQQLRSRNKGLATKVLGRLGGRELLTFMGFRSKGGVEPMLQFEGSSEQLVTTVSWLEAAEPSSKVEVELSIRLPTGATIRAGFERSETVAHVLAYVGRYFLGDRAATLRTTMPTQELHPKETLEALAPRSAVIVAWVGSAEEIEAAMERSHREGLERRAQEVRDRNRREIEIRKEKVARKQDALKAREDTLRNFHADREDKLDQVERGRLKTRPPEDEPKPEPLT